VGVNAGFIQTKSIESPGVAVEKVLYTFFRRSFMRRHARGTSALAQAAKSRSVERGMIWNLKKVLYESLSLLIRRIVVASSSLNRQQHFQAGLMGRLQQPGYERLGN